MARTSMQELIDRLRKQAQARRDDEFGGMVYWSDDQLQDVLDQFRLGPPIRIELIPSEYLTDGSETWWDQRCEFRRHWDYERDFIVVDEDGTTVSSSYYTVEQYGPQLRVVLDPDNTSSSKTYSVQVVLYDLIDATAEVWSQKASMRETLVEERTGAHNSKMNQEREFCERQRDYWRGRKIRGHKLPRQHRFVVDRTW